MTKYLLLLLSIAGFMAAAEPSTTPTSTPGMSAPTHSGPAIEKKKKKGGKKKKKH